MAKTILRDGVYGRLLASILDGSIVPGSNMREERIAADFEVSRTPVREALRKLGEEGFVEYLPHRGARLITPTPELARQIFQIREALEAVAAREAAVRMKDGRLQLLRAHMESLRDKVAEGDLTDVGDVLHEEILRSCGNLRLEHVMQIYRGQIRWLQAVTNRMPRRLVHAFEEHESVLRALEARNPERAEIAIRLHIHNTLHDLVECLEPRP